MKTVTLKLDRIVADPAVQPRVSLNKPTVDEYAERYAAGDTFPPPVVYWDDAINWLSEGFHRVAGWKKADLSDEMEVERRPGSKEDAILNALASNWTHGLRRTNADKRRSVEMALALRPKWADRRISEMVGVSHPFVAEVRAQVVTVTTSTDDQTDTREGKDGKQYPASPPEPTTNGDVVPETRKPALHPDKPADPIPGDRWPADAALTKGTKFYPTVMLLASGSEGVFDAYGQVVPAGTGDYFNDATIRLLRDDVIEERARWTDIRARITRAKSGRMAYPWSDESALIVECDRIVEGYDNLLSLLGDSLPYLVCPDCHGHPVTDRKGCASCRNTGYWPLSKCDEHKERMPKLKRPAVGGAA